MKTSNLQDECTFVNSSAKRVDQAVIEELADREAVLLERIDSLEADRDAYRELAQQALHALHDEHVKAARRKGSYLRLLEEVRGLRVHVRSSEAA